MNFIDQLNYDISQQQLINNNSKLFIKNKNLKLCPINKTNITDMNLPIEAYLGNIFLIKFNSIIQLYCWCDYSHSMYLQICKKSPKWLGSIDILNLEPDDNYIKKYLHDKKIIHLPSNYHFIIKELLKNGFDIYT